MANFTRTPLPDRLWAKVERSEGCWLWTGAKDGHGYGHIQRGGRGGGTVKAHRAVYELLVGPIPMGLELDHLCRVAACVNPAHLEPVTHAENMRRGPGSTKVCQRGHAFTPENTVHWNSPSNRLCLACCRLRSRRRYAREQAVA